MTIFRRVIEEGTAFSDRNSAGERKPLHYVINPQHILLANTDCRATSTVEAETEESGPETEESGPLHVHTTPSLLTADPRHSQTPGHCQQQHQLHLCVCLSQWTFGPGTWWLWVVEWELTLRKSAIWLSKNCQKLDIKKMPKIVIFFKKNCHWQF